jgi:hypothetical protein
MANQAIVCSLSEAQERAICCRSFGGFEKTNSWMAGTMKFHQGLVEIHGERSTWHPASRPANTSGHALQIGK